MSRTIIHIAPSLGIVGGGQCRVYKATTEADTVPLYRLKPELYVECGLMNQQGSVVCFDGTDEQRQALKNDEPLMAGTYLVF